MKIGLTIAVIICLLPMFVISTTNETPHVGRLEQAKTLMQPINERAKAAADILMKDRTMDELSVDEISLLCEAYCNSWQFEKLYKASRLLWQKATGDQRAIEWMQVTLRNEHIDDKDLSEAAAFADLCLTNNYGTITGNTIYKAKTIAIDKKYSGLERKTKIRTLFVDALRKVLSQAFIDGSRAANSFSSTLDYGDLGKVFTDEEKKQLSSELKTLVDQKLKGLIEEAEQEMKTQSQPSDAPNPQSPSAQGADGR